MSKPLKKVFTVKDGDQELELAIVLPSAKVKTDARMEHASAWKQAVERGAIMREALDTHLRNQKLWDDLRQQEYEELRAKILEGVRKIRMGGNAGLTQKTARDLAIQIGEWRQELEELLYQRNRIDNNTADAIADQAQFNYFVAACTVYNNSGKLYFTSDGFRPDVSVYVDKATESVGQTAANTLAEFYYAADANPADQLPEKKFLVEYGFANDKGDLIDKQGRKIDKKGRLLDDNGRFVNESGEFVDVDGNRVNEQGEYVVDFKPFLNDDGSDGEPLGKVEIQSTIPQFEVGHTHPYHTFDEAEEVAVVSEQE